METLVVDENGTIDCVKLTMVQQGFNVSSLLPKDVAIAIKDPYYSFSEEQTGVLLVEHPSNLVQVDLQDSVVPSSIRDIPRSISRFSSRS